jgi:exodeoxyribonuclease-1
VPEAEFIAAIHAEMARADTCTAGYNSVRFDDEVTRFTLYRNLRDAYSREYGQGRSRWDLIDAVRTAYALRPEGIEWPRREDGAPSFRLEDLTRANGLEHGKAHDALGDVRATIALAQLLKERQPRLFAWLYEHRQKQAVRELISLEAREPLLHISGRFGAARANLSLILPLAWHPVNGNEVICADLRRDAQLLLDLPAAELRRLLYLRTDAFKPGEERPGLKSVHINRCPVLLPAKMADERVAERAALDRPACERNLQLLLDHEARHPGALRDKLREMIALDEPEPGPGADPDLALYSGGFFSDHDRRTLEGLVGLTAGELAAATPVFESERLPEMFFRFRARNWPEHLSAEEREDWEAFRFERLTSQDGPGLGLEAYNNEIEQRLQAPELRDRDRRILAALQDWGDALLA